MLHDDLLDKHDRPSTACLTPGGATATLLAPGSRAPGGYGPWPTSNNLSLTWVGTAASGDHSNRRPPPESLNAIGDARIDWFGHF
jgi:hypothetical protein